MSDSVRREVLWLPGTTPKRTVTLRLPVGSHILTAQEHLGALVAWVSVPMNEQTTIDRHLRLVIGVDEFDIGHRTGYVQMLRHIGSVQMLHGNRIFHVFETAHPDDTTGDE